MGWRSIILCVSIICSSQVYVNGGGGYYFLGDSTQKLVEPADAAELYSAIEDLRSKQERYRNQSYFVEHAFYRIHRKFLKKYTQYSSMSQTLREGEYDCVTGTAVYAYVFSQLGYDILIRESTYHVYLEVQTDDGKVLIESTDPIEGAVLEPEEIRSREMEYSRISNADESDQYQFEQISNQPITAKELMGLLYFNQAVKVYNDKELTKAMVYVEEGLKYYPYQRMQEMARLVVKAMQGNKSIHPVIQKVYYNKYVEGNPSVASL